MRYLLAALLIAVTPAAAQNTKISSLPAASPVTGAELIFGSQGSGCASKAAPCQSVTITPVQLGKYLATDPSIVAAYQPLDVDLSAIAALSTQPFGRARLTDPDAATARGAIGAAASGANSDISSITGSAARWTTARTVTASGDVGWSFSIDGSANVTTTTALASTGVTAGSYGGALSIPTVTIDGKGRVTSASTVALGTVPIGQGGTGATTAAAGLSALGGQPVAPNLTAISGLSTAADQCGYWTGTATASLYGCTSYGRGLVGSASAAAARTTLGLATVAASGAPTDLVQTPYTDYSPTASCLSGTLTSATLKGRWTRVGKTIFVHGQIAITTNGSCATGILITLPVTAYNTGTSGEVVSNMAGRESNPNAGSYRLLQVIVGSNSSTMTVVVYNNNYAGADNTTLSFSGSYEGA